MNPFVYPKSKHVRREKPGELSPYSKYKPFLQREFERKCIYCRMPDSMQHQHLYGVEHYRPKSRFPELITSYRNLFYACNPCNQRKGEYWPPRGKGTTHFIPNPCDHEMFKHLRFAGPVVEAKSTAGEVARDLLDLNDGETVKYRTFIISLIESHEEKKALLDRTRTQLQELRQRGEVSDAELAVALATIDQDLITVREHLDRLSGH